MSDFKYVDFLDYLCYASNRPQEHILAGVITDKQCVVDVKPKKEYDHWNIIEEIHKKVYPNETVEQANLFEDAIVLFSGGNDLIVSLPNEVTMPQLECFLSFLRQARMFEQEIGGLLHTVYLYNELAVMAKDKLVDKRENEKDEVIIGEDIKKYVRKRTE